MHKLQSSLLIATVVCSAVQGLVASEKPFFDQPTQDVVKKTAQYYGYGYAGFYATGTGFAVRGAVALTPMLVATIRQFNRQIYRGITRSTLVTAPVVFGSVIAYHKYQEQHKE